LPLCFAMGTYETGFEFSDAMSDEHDLLPSRIPLAPVKDKFSSNHGLLEVPNASKPRSMKEFCTQSPLGFFKLRMSPRRVTAVKVVRITVVLSRNINELADLP
jgi:hypothetical protein